MNGNFSYSNPTKLYFGEDSLNYLDQELPKYGKKILLTYGGGSIKNNGIYKAVLAALKKNGKEIVELPGVMPNPTSDYLAEGLMRSVIHASRIAVENPEDYEARSNIMWDATWALNTLIAKGKSTDWMVHMIGQAVGAYTDATHGMTLSAVSLAYYRSQLQAGLPKFVRFAKNVWAISTDGKSDLELAEAGLEAMKDWMQEIGVSLSLKELGVTEDMFEGIASATFILDGGYKVLTKDEVVQVLKESM